MIRKNGKSYEVRVYDPATKKNRYVGMRRRWGDARQLERDKETEFREAFEAERRGDEPEEIRTCREYARRWLRVKHGPGTRRPARSTLKFNDERLRLFLRKYGDRRLDGGISRREALDWALQNPNHAKVASAMFNDAIDDMLCSGNPFANRRQEKAKGRQHITPLTEQEVDRLAAIAGRMWKGYGRVVHAWIIYLAWVGCRPQEMASAEWPHLDLEAGRVRIRRVKPPYKTHSVVLPDRAAAAIVEMNAERSGRVFETVQGKPLDKGSWHYYWDPVRKAFLAEVEERHPERATAILNGRPDFDLYELRHFCGSVMADRGATAQDIAHQLGNSAKVCEETYIHTFEDRANQRNADLLNQPVVSLDEHRRRKDRGA